MDRSPLPRRRVLRPMASLSLAAGLVVAVSACDPPGGETSTRTGCEETVREASVAVEVDEQVRLLDDALIVCRTYDALAAQIDRYPSMLGYDTPTFVAVRCARVDDERVQRSPSCRNVITPTTTAPPTTVATLVYVGDTLDGRRVEIRPSATTDFVGDVPAVVQQTVDIAVESGCPGVIEQRDRWAARVGDPVIGDEASVYAQHAQNVADYIQCDLEPIDPATLGG